MRKIIYSVVALLALWSCNDNDNVTAKPGVDITGEVTDVVKVCADLTVNLSTDKACYKPGETVTFTATGDIPSGAKVRYRNQTEVVDEQPVSGGSWTWTAPATDFTGYLADVYTTGADGTETVLGTIGVDVSSDWTRFPRYGFVATFDQSKTAEGVIEDEMEYLNRCHINGVQFQDWHNKHHWPLGGTRDSLDEVYKDIANRDVYTSVIKKYIDVQHSYGMKSMFYNLCFGALSDAAADGVKEEWYLFKDTKHTTKDKHDLPDTWKSDIFLVDPSNKEWQKYIGDRNDDVYANFDFDGYQIDQLGDRGSLYTYDGGKANLQLGYGSFINAMKERHPDKRLVMNAVSSFGTYSIAKTGKVDFLYNELWDSESSFSSLCDIIHNNEQYSQGKLQTVFAAYMDYSKEQGKFNTPGVLLTDAVMFALGGAHLELGDHMLCREYFPNNSLAMSAELKDAIVRYYDFMTAYQNLLRGGGEETDAGVSSTSGVTVGAWPPALGSVASFARQVGDKKVVHLLNFVNADNLSWRDMQGTMPEPELIEGLPLRMKADKKVNKIWVATPDALGGAVQELPFKQAGGEVTFTVPTLKYWTMIVVE